jgi:hypothetical protein
MASGSVKVEIGSDNAGVSWCNTLICVTGADEGAKKGFVQAFYGLDDKPSTTIRFFDRNVRQLAPH